MIRSWFSNLKFAYKVLIGIVCVTTLAMFLIVQVSREYMAKRSRDESLLQAKNSVYIADTILDSQLRAISGATNFLLLDDPFKDMITSISTGESTSYASSVITANDKLAAFMSNNALLSGAFLYAEDGSFLSIANVGNRTEWADMFYEDIFSLPQITLLPRRHNDVTRIGQTVPVVCPITRTGEFFYYRMGQPGRRACFVLLIDAVKLSDMLAHCANTFTDIIYLANEEGAPLNIDTGTYPAATMPELIAFAAQAEGIAQARMTLNGESIYVTAGELKLFGLKIVHIVKQTALTKSMSPMGRFFLLLGVAGVAVAALLSLAMTNFLLKPLKKVTSMIGSINDRTYTTRQKFKYRDEIGMLGNQINSMYDTIEKQFATITEEEHKNAQAEMRMLSEQINPHFLYNTLESIHLHVLNGHNQIACSILEGLGKYLRITLSFGGATISVAKELEHVTEYLNLMKRSRGNSIQFTCTADENVKMLSVMKIILQPLAENSLKHGFERDVNALPPTIAVRVAGENGRIVLSVTDNGKGMDAETAKRCMLTASDGKAQHFGLNNLYRRLKGYYGDQASVTFASIPYYKTTVTISVPAMDPHENH